MAQFVSEHGDEMRVIGLGSQDSLGEAEEFVAATGTEGVEMLWDESFVSWDHYGIRSQPAAILLDANGDAIEGWSGNVPNEDALRAAGL